MPHAPIYLDYNATTPIAPEVAEAMAPFLFEHFGNPSSGHAYGAVTRDAVAKAREEVARLLGASPGEIVFTSGGTESNNMAILGAARARAAQGRHLITSTVEHPAVNEPLRALEREGFAVTRVGVDDQGRVDPADVARALRGDTTLVTVMHANNEVGTVQPIRELADLAHEAGALLHTDAAQSIGKIPVRVDDLGADLLTVAGHKLYGPKGVGALTIREGVDLSPLLFGAAQEGGRRPGTENVLEIVGLGRAAALAAQHLPEAGARLGTLRDRLWQALEASDLDVRRNGGEEPCLPNTLSVGFRGLEAPALLEAVKDEVAASAGAACHAEGVKVSAVLEAMDVPPAYARGTLRLSLGHPTTIEDIDRAAAALIHSARRSLGTR